MTPRALPIAAAVLVAALASGCGGRQKARLGPDETGVGKVELVGVVNVDKGALRAGLGLERAKDRNQPFARYHVTLDRRRIEGYYLRRGYLKTTVESSFVIRNKRAYVTFKIVEGPRARLTAVNIEGLPPGSPVEADELRQLIPLADGGEFDYDVYELARPALTAVLEEEGYAHARIEGTIFADKERNTVSIKLAVEAGPKARFGAVEVKGVEGKLARTVERRLHIKEGDDYSLQAIADSRADLYELGRFSLVRLETDKEGKGPVVPVAVTIGERPRHELRLGGGVGLSPMQYETRARSAYRIAGWPTTLMNTGLELRPAIVRTRDEGRFEPRIEAVGTLERIDLFRPRMNGSAEGSFSYLTVEAYTSYGPRLHLGLRTPLYKRLIMGSVGWQIAHHQFRDIDPVLDMATITRLGLDQPERLGSFDQSVVLDLRDDPLMPSRGVYAELRAEEGTVAAGGAFTYLRLWPELRGYVTGFGVTFAARLGLGMFVGDVPPTQRFYGGGVGSQRGFSERRLSPQVVGFVDDQERRVPIGGGAIGFGGFELRRHLKTFRQEIELGGIWFVDAAEVGERVGDISVGNLHWATGVGLRLKYKLPIRFDVGYRLNRVGPMDPDPATSTWQRLAYHFLVGEAF